MAGPSGDRAGPPRADWLSVPIREASIRVDPLGPEHYAALVRAGRSLRSARRCERLAGSSGTLTLVAGLASLPFVLGSGVGVALAVVLVVVGWRERALRAGVRGLDPLACGRLARNQLALGAALIGYAAVKLADGPGALLATTGASLEQAPELAAAADRVVRLAHGGLYAGMILGATIVQGSQAAYYGRVGRSLRRAHATHPVWAMRVHAAAWGGQVAPGRAEGHAARADRPGDDAPARAA